MQIDEQKTAINARVKASTRAFLRAKTWEEKVRAIERMNEMSRVAKEGMQKVKGQDEVER